ncbi:MAG: ARMT1-like domain-containing protein [Prolixibacteraceae bacterium]|jgi:uncharacterized protein with ATP-grasp and redox domains|nr:ARMT1-like domain-containing protein [Prolixibacteraceae bacterium]
MKGNKVATDYRCYFCFARAFERIIEKENLSSEEKQKFASDLFGMFNTEKREFSVPAFSRDLHHFLRQYIKNPDPYKEAKRQSNDLALSMYPDFKKMVLESENPFETALRLAIAGNIIDYGVSDHFDLEAALTKVLNSDFTIDHSSELKNAVTKAKTVLYLGDNTGEIVFDKLFIETMMHPNLWFAVRGAPVINDATLEDAHYVGIDEVSDVISNGYDAPSTLPEHCSAEFQELFNRADVIVSKGQGNLEGLIDNPSNKEIYFLLMVKCDVIADVLGVAKGSFVVCNRRLLKEEMNKNKAILEI